MTNYTDWIDKHIQVPQSCCIKDEKCNTQIPDNVYHEVSYTLTFKGIMCYIYTSCARTVDKHCESQTEASICEHIIRRCLHRGCLLFSVRIFRLATKGYEEADYLL